MNRRLKLFLTLSITLNVLLAGMIAGWSVQRWNAHPWQAVREELDPQSRNVVARVFQKARRDMHEQARIARAARKDMIATLKADTFDEQAFDKNLTRMREAQMEVMNRKAETVKELAMELSVSDRQKLAKHLVRALGGHERRIHRARKPRVLSPEQPAADTSKNQE
ncbi:MAG: periplasmic heavy metal sensor [Alphaproteobacteria bacterium]|nr:periplasmic heavy metal sensor [Alphaproteobacteria bacterium]